MSDNDVACVEAGCIATIKNNKWAKIKAEGWFFSKDLSADSGYCPDHIPGWVEAWRAKKRLARPKDDTIWLTATCSSCGWAINKSVGDKGIWIHTDTKEVGCPKKDSS